MAVRTSLEKRGLESPLQEMRVGNPGKGASQGALVVKNPSTNAGDLRNAGSILGLGRFTGRGHGNLFQYSCQENPMDRGVWWATVLGVTQRDD